jgi:hypothetical protein
MKAKIPKTASGDDKIGPLIDGLIDQTIAVMKGEQEKVTMPASIATLIPAKGSGGMVGMGDMPAAALPKATGLAKNPKGSMAGMSGM